MPSIYARTPLKSSNGHLANSATALVYKLACYDRAVFSKLPIMKLTVWSVLAGVLSIFASASVTHSVWGDPVGTLSWYNDAPGRYTDNQTVTGKKRFILTDNAIGANVRNYGYLKWCVSLNGQPLLMTEKAGQGLDNETTMYLYFEAGSLLAQNAQTESGCWHVAQKDIEYSSDGFDLTINTASWPDGLHTLTFIGHHKTGVVGTKSIKLNTLNSTSQVKVSSSSGNSLSGSTKLTVDYSRMNRASNVCLRRNNAPADSSFKFLGAAPDANGCWPIVETGTYIIGGKEPRSLLERWSGTRTAEFTVNTLSWPDGAQVIEAVVPHVYPEIGSGSAAFTSLNPALGLNVSGLTDGEQVNGLRTVSIASVINAVHTSQIQTATYCIDFDNQLCLYSSKSTNSSATFTFESQKYVDGPHSLKLRVIDSAGREASKLMSVQISNGKPIVTGAKVSTNKPGSASGTASATIEFNAPRSSAATVRVAAGKGNASQIDIDLLSSSGGAASATFESLKPATKFIYQITARNANGESKTVTGKFTTPAAPKKVSRGGGSGQSSGSGYGISVIGWRLDRALAALGWSRSQAAEASGCPNPTWLGIINLDNWIVVGQTSSMLYACKP